MSQLFYFDKALKALQYSQTLTSKDGILTRLIKQLTEAFCLQSLNPIWPILLLISAIPEWCISTGATSVTSLLRRGAWRYLSD